MTPTSELWLPLVFLLPLGFVLFLIGLAVPIERTESGSALADWFVERIIGGPRR